MFLSSHGGSQPPRWSFHSQRTGGPTLQLPERHRKWTLGTPLWQSPQSPGTSRRQESTLRVRHNGTHLSALNLKPHLFCSAGKHQGSQDAISGRDLGGNSVLTKPNSKLLTLVQSWHLHSLTLAHGQLQRTTLTSKWPWLRFETYPARDLNYLIPSWPGLLLVSVSLFNSSL